LLFPVFDNFPKFIGKHITSLMQLLLGLGVFPQVRELIRKLVEVLDKLVQELLLVIQTLQVLQELALNAGS